MKNKSKINIEGIVYLDKYDQIPAVEKELKERVSSLNTTCYQDAVGFRFISEDYEEYEYLIETLKYLMTRYSINSIGFETNGKNKVSFENR